MSFVKEATSAIVNESPAAQVGVLQFSNDVKDEVAVGTVEDIKAFADAVDAVVRARFVWWCRHTPHVVMDGVVVYGCWGSACVVYMPWLLCS